MAFLRDQGSTKEWPLRGKITLIGRDPSCDVVIAILRALRPVALANSLVPGLPRISRSR